jgi:glycosyltransferase involved in cell wall biosynthesis
MNESETYSGSRSDAGAKPRFTVVLEGYNESLQLGSADRFIDGLRRQSIPVREVQVILVGSAEQCAHWQALLGTDSSFYSVETIPASGAHYYRLKNRGVKAAMGDIIVLADTDVVPAQDWLAGIDESFRAGAEASAGLSMFYCDLKTPWPQWMLDVAASISWGFILGRRNERWIEPRGFLSHNIAFRRSVVEKHLYPEEFGRTCAGSVLYTRLVEDGVKIVLNPRQRVYHAFSLRWWVGRLHVRFGYEVYRLRRLGSPVVDARASRLGVLEPLLTMGWHVLVDIPQWFRYSDAAGWGTPSRILALPVLLLLSILARGSEMIAMYRTMAQPNAMEEFALRS